jgi:hypothetical protein
VSAEQQPAADFNGLCLPIDLCKSLENIPGGGVCTVDFVSMRELGKLLRE